MTRAPFCVHRPHPSPLVSLAARGPGRCAGAGLSLGPQSFWRSLRAALGAAAAGLLLLSSACGDEPAVPALDADAGPSCERGTRNCECIGGSRCQADLLCIAGLCSSRPEDEPEEMGPRPRPRPTPPDPAEPDRDAGLASPADAGALDASVPAADSGATPVVDAG
jgi:hypothetical protein